MSSNFMGGQNSQRPWLMLKGICVVQQNISIIRISKETFKYLLQILLKYFLSSSMNSWNAFYRQSSFSTISKLFQKLIEQRSQSQESTVIIFLSDCQMCVLCTHCSNLNEHLISKNIIESLFRTCGNIENISTSTFPVLSPIYYLSIVFCLFRH